MRSTTFLTTALQLGTFLTAAEAARGRRRDATGYGNEDAVQWSAWSVTTFQTMTTPYHHPEGAKPTDNYQSWVGTTSKAYKPLYHEEQDNEEWNDWEEEEDEYVTTRSHMSIPTMFNLFPTTTTTNYQTWQQAPKQYTTEYNSWEAAKPSPTTFMHQSWVGTSKRYNGDDEDYQDWEEASTKVPEVYSTWTQATAAPTADEWHTWLSTSTDAYSSWSATPTAIISYSTKVITVEEYASWSETATYTTDMNSAWSKASHTPEAYSTWSEATPTYKPAMHTKPAEQVQEWGQWQGQVQGNGNKGKYGNGNGNSFYTTTTTSAFLAIPTNPAAAGGAGAIPGLQGLGAGLGGLGGLGL